MMNEQTRKVILIAVCLFFAFSGCALRKELVIPRAKLQESVAKKFPYAKDFGIVRITVESPEVYFKGKNIGVKTLYYGNFLNNEIQGHVDVNGSITYSPETGTFYLRDLVISDLTANENSVLEGMKLQKTIDKIIGTYLEGFPLYQLNPNDYKENLARSLVRDILIRDDDLVILLGK